jgi:hypothetical protein
MTDSRRRWAFALGIIFLAFAATSAARTQHLISIGVVGPLYKENLIFVVNLFVGAMLISWGRLSR